MNEKQKGHVRFFAFIAAAFACYIAFSILVPYPGELWSEIMHKFNHEQYRWVVDGSQQALLEGRFEGHPVGGMQTGHPGNIRTGLQYAYFHDAAERVYYYRFRNVGKTDFCFSSRLLPPLIGKSKLHLLAGEAVYLAVASSRAPVQSCANVHLWKECKLIHSMFAGGSCMLVPGNE